MKQLKENRRGFAKWALLAVLCLRFSSVLCASHLTYPLTSGGIDSRYDYDWAVLRTALEKTEAGFGVFEMQQSDIVMSPQRVTQELLSPAGHINIFVRATDAELERQFIPIRIPVDRGLLGYRIFLARSADLPRFAAVKSLEDLRGFRAGQGKEWVDVPILRVAGLNV